jgi:hypothetical protein
MTAFWDMAVCCLVEVYRHFEGAYYLHHQDNEQAIALMTATVRTSETSI